MPRAGDLRALDGLITLPDCRVAVEAWTRLADVQAQVRSAELKRRDIGAERLIVLLADTPHNRAAVRASERILRTSFPLRTREIMNALGRGRDPGADGIVLLTPRRSQVANGHARPASKLGLAAAR